MKCAICGNEVPENADDCPTCGAPRRINTVPPSPAIGPTKRADPLAGSTQAPAVPAGSLFNKRYKVIGLLGQGGMGAVYRCEDLQLGRQVAVKCLLPQLSGESWSIPRFETEARAIASVNHQNVIQVFDLAEDENGKYIVMELVEGQTLAHKIEREGPLSMSETTRIMLQVGMGLDAAHNKGVIHRDIKPGNIMFTSTGRVKLGDFGIARLEGAHDITTTGTAMGTWVYASPEQLDDAKNVDFRTDIYSMGATMYEMLSGEIPRHIHEEKIPGLILHVVKKCLAKSPGDRYQGAGEFVVALAEAHKAAARLEGPIEEPPAPVQEADTVNAATTPIEIPRQPTAIKEPRPTDTGRRRERILWRARGAARSCPIQTAFGVTCLALFAFLGADANRYAKEWIDALQYDMLNQSVLAEVWTADVFRFLRSLPWSILLASIGGILTVLPILGRVTTRFRLSSTRLTIKKGLLFRRESDFPLNEIQEVHVSQGILGQILRYGDIVLHCRFAEAITLRGVPDPSRARDKITGALHGV